MDWKKELELELGKGDDSKSTDLGSNSDHSVNRQKDTIYSEVDISVPKNSKDRLIYSENGKIIFDGSVDEFIAEVNNGSITGIKKEFHKTKSSLFSRLKAGFSKTRQRRKSSKKRSHKSHGCLTFLLVVIILIFLMWIIIQFAVLPNIVNFSRF